MPNILGDLPADLSEETFETIASGKNVRLERIVSNGHTTPQGEWYDQAQNEWVLVLSGRGDIEFENGRTESLRIGDHLLIGKRSKHRVSYTDPKTVWLAVHFD